MDRGVDGLTFCSPHADLMIALHSHLCVVANFSCELILSVYIYIDIVHMYMYVLLLLKICNLFTLSFLYNTMTPLYHVTCVWRVLASLRMCYTSM